MNSRRIRAFYWVLLTFPSCQGGVARRAGVVSYPFRSTTQSPITSTSIIVRRKQSGASCGLHATGSFSLNEMLSRHAGQCLERLDQPVIARVRLPLHRLQPLRAVHVRHHGDQRALRLAVRVTHRHRLLELVAHRLTGKAR